MKKILAILLALTMVLGLGVAVFAVEATLTVNVVWAGDEEDPSGRPESLTETAFVGVAGFSFTVSSDNGWTSTQSIDYDPTSDEITCSPATVEGYSDSAAIDGTNVTITYTKSEEEPTPTPSETLPGVVNPHTITITNTDQNVDHTYSVYQIFKGNLNAAETTLSDIQWGDSVTDGAGLIAALKASTNLKADAAYVASTTNKEANKDALGNAIAVNDNIFKNCNTVVDVAKVLATVSSTATYTAATHTLDGTNEAAGMLDEIAKIIGGDANDTTHYPGFVTAVAKKNAAGDASSFTQNGTTYTADVYGDGYYLIKDTTTTLNSTDGKSDTLARYMLTVIRNETIVAKDTGLTPDKKIDNGTAKVAADSAAIGDKVKFEVTVNVPNTKKYQDHFVFDMTDTLPAGLTFFGLDKIQINGTDLPTANYELTAKTGTTTFTVPATESDAVTTTGGQVITILFKDFKNYVETNDLIGKQITITYFAVVNEKAEFGATGNKNEVKFDYSNDPNHTYGGDEFESTDPKGTTPGSTTTTYVTTLEITKKNDKNEVLEGATFKLEGTALNHVLVTGEKFENSGYTAQTGETIESGTYYKLKDGSYTTTVPGGSVNVDQYDDTSKTYVKVSYAKDVVNSATIDVTATSDKNGIIRFEGLNEGEYTLTEITAPDGYNLLKDPITINIAWDDPTATGAAAAIVAAGGFSIGTGSSADLTMTADGVKYQIAIINNAGSELPSTGGIGTTIFYIVGGLLAVGAGVVLVTKKRMGKEEN